jgi:SAM-dependent methyltransferase
MKIKQHNSYEHYKNEQIIVGKQGFEDNTIFTNENEIKFLCNYILNNNIEIKNGICHGVRRGIENLTFAKYLDANIIGTDICELAEQNNIQNVITWDFHDIKIEWINYFDLIYSNSLDHSFNPELALSQWFTTLNKNGICIIEHTSSHNLDEPTLSDCFSANFDEYKKMIENYAKIIEILELNNKKFFISKHYE